MRIAQIAPLYESVPPKLYGGTERVVSHLSDALVKRGHEVALFASADSNTRAHLVPCRDVALRLDRKLSWDLPAHWPCSPRCANMPISSTFFTSISTVFTFRFLKTWPIAP